MSHGFLSPLTGLILFLVHLPTDKSVGDFLFALTGLPVSLAALARGNKRKSRKLTKQRPAKPRKKKRFLRHSSCYSLESIFSCEPIKISSVANGRRQSPDKVIAVSIR